MAVRDANCRRILFTPREANLLKHEAEIHTLTTAAWLGDRREALSAVRPCPAMRLLTRPDSNLAQLGVSIDRTRNGPDFCYGPEILAVLMRRLRTYCRFVIAGLAIQVNPGTRFNPDPGVRCVGTPLGTGTRRDP